MGPTRDRGPRFRLHRVALRAGFRAERWVPRRLHWWLARRVFADVAAGTCVLLFDEQLRVFLVSSTYGDGWSTPGGFVARGETAPAAASREVAEELGVHPVLVEVAGALRGDRPVVDVVFCGRLAADAPVEVDGMEIGAYRWFDLAEGLPPSCDPEVPAALATLQRCLGADGLEPVLSAADQQRLRQLLTATPVR